MILDWKFEKLLFTIFCFSLVISTGCTPNHQLTTSQETTNGSFTNQDGSVTIKVTEAALPMLKSGFQSAGNDEAIMFTAKWPAGICCVQHHMEIGKPTSEHEIVEEAGIRIAFIAKYKKFFDGIVVDYGTRGKESGLIIKNPDQDLYSIIHSKEDSQLMAEMLGRGFVTYRDSVLSGGIILEPKNANKE